MVELAPGTTVKVRNPGFVRGVIAVGGNAGPAGPANTLTVGTVSAGDDAAVTITGTAPHQTLNLTLPRGAAGPETNWTIGTVTTGDPGTAAAATVTGTAPNLTLNLTLPAGMPGAGNVDDVNGVPGPHVVLTAANVGALSSSSVVPDGNLPTRLSDTSLSAAYVASSKVGAANGVPTLDAGGKVPASQLPSSVMQFQGQWNASTNTPHLADGTGDAGDIYWVNTAGTQNLGSGSQVFAIGDWAMYDGTKWDLAHAGADTVQSVAGLAGAISASGLKTALSLDQVSNTSDANKPVSTAQQTALNAKQDTSAKGAANGYASLDATGKVPSSQLPTATSSNAPLARVSYAPAATVSVTSPTSPADVDATNLAVTFTAPSSGKVRLTLEAYANVTSGLGYWLLRTTTSTNVAGTERMVGAVATRVHVDIPISGLTAGTSYTYRWGHRSPNTAQIGYGGSSSEFSGTNLGPAIMTVYGE